MHVVFIKFDENELMIVFELLIIKIYKSNKNITIKYEDMISSFN